MFSCIRTFIALLLLFPLTLQAEISAEIDKTTIYQGQKFTLTIETDQKNEPRPDLRPLQEGFNLLGSRKINVSSHSTGLVTNKTRWQLQLRPLNEGEQVVPVLQVGTEQTPQLSLSVLPAEQNPAFTNTGRNLFLDVVLSTDEVYVGGQTLLKAKIYHIAPLPLDSQLSTPESADMLIKLLEEQKQYTEIVRGQNYTVTETTYALYPRKEGLLETSPLFFSATLPGEQYIELNSEPLLINSLPQAFTNTLNIWLPAKSVYIEDNLNETTALAQSDKLHRIITLEAEGLPASALPAMAVLDNELADVQLLNVVLEEKMTDSGIVSTRMEEISIRPNEQGEITLPAIDIPWWNTETETGQTATLRQKALIVSAPKPVTAIKAEAEISQTPSHEESNLLIWLLAAVSLLSSAGFIYALKKMRNLQMKRDQENSAADQHDALIRKQAANAINERNMFQALAQSCDQGNPELTQLRLIEWAQVFWEDTELHSLEQVCVKADNQTFNFLILDLEQHLYNNELWQGDLLIEAVDKLRSRKQRQLLDLDEGDENFSYIT